MNITETKQFFADFCDANPMTAHRLMMQMINNPTGGEQNTLPSLVSQQDMNRYYNESHELAKKYILKPRTEN